MKSLKTWQQALLRGEARVRVVFGTKGGRPRDTTVTDWEKMLHAVNHALTVATAQNGRLVDRPDLKSVITHSFVSNPLKGTLIKLRPNGDTMYYNPSTNTFAVKNADGTPKTMFRPENGMEYWEKQK